MFWLRPELNFETHNLYSRHTSACPLVSMQRWRHSLNETLAIHFFMQLEQDFLRFVEDEWGEVSETIASEICEKKLQ